MVKKNFALTFLLAIFFSMFAPMQLSNAADLSETGNRAFEDLTRCINTKKALDVYYLIDQSGSLKRSDKNDDRADILAASLLALGDFESGVKVSYAVTFFGDAPEKWASWTPVTDSTIGSKAQALENELRKSSRKSDWNTDWLAALNQAKSDLTSRASQSSACQALIFLTDGGIWLQQGEGYGGEHTYDENRTNDAVAQLCQNILPSLHKNQVSVFGVLLKNNEQINAMDPQERSITLDGMSKLLPLIEGSGKREGLTETSMTCGPTPLPANQSAGALMVAEDPVALALQFLVLTASTQGGIEAELPPGNPTNFTIDKGVRHFRLITSTKQWTLSGPQGQQYTGPTAGVEVDQSSGVSSITVEVGMSEIGKWNFKFDKGAVNRLILFSGLDVEISKSGMVAGVNGSISGQITTKSQAQPVDINAYKKAPVKIEKILPNGNVVLLGEVYATKGGAFKLDKFTALENETQIELRITMPLTTQGGTKLAPLSVTQVIQIPNNSEYPTLEEFPVNIGETKGTDKATGSIKVVGPQNGSGSICFNQGSNNGISTVDDSSQEDRTFAYEISGLDANGCVSLAQNEKREIPISVTPSARGEGDVSASMPITRHSDAQPENIIDEDIPVEFKTSILQAWSWLVKVLLYFLGIGLPWLFSYLTNRSTTKIALGEKIQRATFDILISQTKGITNRDGSQLVVRNEDFKFIPSQPNTTVFKDPMGEMRARVSFNVFKAPWFEIAAPAGFRFVTMRNQRGAQSKRFKCGVVAPIAGNIDGVWAMRVSEEDLRNPQNSSSIPATLLIFKRNKLSRPQQHTEYVQKAIQTPGIWNVIASLPKEAQEASMSAKTPKTEKAKKAKKGDVEEKKETTVTPPPPPPTPMRTPPPPPMPPPPPPTA